eukprot:COSAG01_NODE_2675_length_7264_cov_29.639358_1_plen_217_part_10
MNVRARLAPILAEVVRAQGRGPSTPARRFASGCKGLTMVSFAQVLLDASTSRRTGRMSTTMQCYWKSGDRTLSMRCHRLPHVRPLSDLSDHCPRETSGALLPAAGHARGGGGDGFAACLARDAADRRVMPSSTSGALLPAAGHARGGGGDGLAACPARDAADRRVMRSSTSGALLPAAGHARGGGGDGFAACLARDAADRRVMPSSTSGALLPATGH